MTKHNGSQVRVPIELDNPSIMRNEELCIFCGQCATVCKKDIGVYGTFDLEKTGDVAVCVNCGQCANVCPVSSITAKYEYEAVAAAIADPEKVVIFSTSPSVRIALGEEFGMEAGSDVEGKMVAVLRALGADYVLDTNFAADLTIMEEASELIERITTGSKPLPQFTSCCPAWVKYAETYHPDMLPHISTAKSPIGMQGPTIKTYFAKKMGIDPAKIVNVAVTPCTAKKYEIRRDEMNAASKELEIEGLRDMDHVITTAELAKWTKERGFRFELMDGMAYDELMGAASGAGVIFGNTGGVMEAAIRTAYEFITGEKAPEALYTLEPVRGMEEIREASLMVGDLEVNVAVVYGTANASKMIEKLKNSDKQYHFIEVMTCPGGCIGGGGQPKAMLDKAEEVRAKRIAGLYEKDAKMELRLSHENPDIKMVYEEFYGKPLSEMAERMLHTSYADKSADLGGGVDAEVAEEVVAEVAEVAVKKYRCKICGHVHEGDFPEGYVCPLCKQPKEMFEEI